MLVLQNAFHGPLHTFGKLLYTQMVRQTASGDRERITKEQFTKAGKELLKLYDESSQQEYYFKLFASGKDHLTKEGRSLIRFFCVFFLLRSNITGHIMLPVRKRASCCANVNCPQVNLFIFHVIKCRIHVALQHYKCITSVEGHDRDQRSHGKTTDIHAFVSDVF